MTIGEKHPDSVLTVAKLNDQEPHTLVSYLSAVLSLDIPKFEALTDRELENSIKDLELNDNEALLVLQILEFERIEREMHYVRHDLKNSVSALQMQLFLTKSALGESDEQIKEFATQLDSLGELLDHLSINRIFSNGYRDNHGQESQNPLEVINRRARELESQLVDGVGKLLEISKRIAENQDITLEKYPTPNTDNQKEDAKRIMLRNSLASIFGVLSGLKIFFKEVDFQRDVLSRDSETLKNYSVQEILERLIGLAQREVLAFGFMNSLRIEFLNIEGIESNRFFTSIYLLESTVRNLVQNACKYGSQDQQEPKIVVRFSQENILWDGQNLPALKIEIQDHGAGIPAEKQKQIFERNYRINSGSQYPPGSGYGLALVKRNAEFLDYHYAVESEPGQGSTFSIVIPLMPLSQVNN